MILATQEHSPLFVVQALDRVLDILRSTDIYSPQFTGLKQNHAEDQVASDLFSGLISVCFTLITQYILYCFCNRNDKILFNLLYQLQIPKFDVH